jgi:hypothetical protein
MNMYKFFPVFIFIIFIFFSKCNTTEPPPDNRKLTLTFEDVSCTEAWIQLTTENLQLPATINILVNDSLSHISILSTQDSLFYIDSLLPNQSYTIQTFIHSTNQPELISNELSITTMDTTTHNFTWQTWTIGNTGNNVLFDVAIINENNIWAVGEINISDTSVNGYTTYNAVHWNGNEWELHQIFYYTICGQQSKTPYPISSVFVFSENEIWVAMRGDQISKIINGSQTQPICLQWSFTINKIWGRSSQDLYVVGSAGNIVHYNGSTWTKIESGTTVNLTDIYGTPDGSEVWACGWNDGDGHTVLLRINNNQSEIIYDSFNPNGLPYNHSFISSLWSSGKQYFWLSGVSNGAIKHSFLNKNFTVKENFGIQYFPYRIRGTEVNNISLAGDAAMLWHFNGYSWVLYEELLNMNDRIRSLDIKGNIIVAVGRRYESILSGGLIIMGKR